MRVLFDECMRRALCSDLPGHEVTTVAEAGLGWRHEWRVAATGGNSVRSLVTVDRNLEYQQNFAAVAVAVIVIHAPNNDIAVLGPLMPEVLAAIPLATSGTMTHVGD
jgi:hypothetical protein